MTGPDIKGMRLRRGMTQEQVGLLAGMSKSQISRMESGQLGSAETFSRVLLALGYRAVTSYIDDRPGSELNKASVLSMLKVYYLCNKKDLGINELGLFGSFARDETGPDSDIDIIISLERADLFQYATISRQLEKIFGRKIDLISSSAILRKDFAEQLKKDVIYVSE